MFAAAIHKNFKCSEDINYVILVYRMHYIGRN